MSLLLFKGNRLETWNTLHYEFTLTCFRYVDADPILILMSRIKGHDDQKIYMIVSLEGIPIHVEY